MNKEQIWNIVLIISIVLVIHGLTKTGSPDKKEAQTAQGEAITGVGGIIAFAVKKQLWYVWLIVPAAIPFIFTQYRNLVSPPTIPGWVWGVGFVLLAFMALKKR